MFCDILQGMEFVVKLRRGVECLQLKKDGEHQVNKALQ